MGLGDLVRQPEELVGLLAHGADHQNHLIATGPSTADMVGDLTHPLAVGDRGAPELLHDQSHLLHAIGGRHGLRSPSVETDSRALGIHAGEVVALAWGRCLSLLPSRMSWGPLPPTVHSVVGMGDLGHIDGAVDSILSVGQLGATDDLGTLLDRLRTVASEHTDLLFCEPTIVEDEPAPGAPHDVTTTLWSRGWSVVDCHRFRHGRGRRPNRYVWGRARLTRRAAPPEDVG
jgi:hypothetical protein